MLSPLLIMEVNHHLLHTAFLLLLLLISHRLLCQEFAFLSFPLLASHAGGVADRDEDHVDAEAAADRGPEREYHTILKSIHTCLTTSTIAMQKKPAVLNVDTLLGEIRQWIRDADATLDVLYREAQLSESWSVKLTCVTYTLTQFCDLAEHEQRLAEHFVAQSRLAFAESRAFYVAMGDREPHLLYDELTAVPLSCENHAIFVTPPTTTTTTTTSITATTPSLEQEGVFRRLQTSLFYASERHNELVEKHEAEEKYTAFLSELASLRTDLTIPATTTLLTHETRQRLTTLFDEPVVVVIEKMRTTLETLREEKCNLFVYLSNTMLLFARCSAAFHNAQKRQRQPTNHLPSMYEDLPVVTGVVGTLPLVPRGGREKTEQIVGK